MPLYLNCQVSEAQIEPNDITGTPPIDPAQPAHVRVGPLAGDWVQLTYSQLRSAPDGDVLAWMDFSDQTGFWHLIEGMPVLSATRHDGSRYPVQYTPNGWLFTDIIITEEAV